MFVVPFKKINQNNLQPLNQRNLKTEKIFMNTENSKTNEPHRFRLSLADKLLNPNKNIALGNLVSNIHGKTLNQHTATINLKLLLQLGIMLLISLMVLILLLIFKITFNLSPKNMKL